MAHQAKVFDTAAVDLELAQLTATLETLAEQLAFNHKTTGLHRTELATLAADLAREQEVVGGLERQVQELQVQLDAAEDQVFAGFCAAVGLRSIREYSARLAVLASKSSSVQKQALRVENQVKCQARLLEDVEARRHAMQGAMAADEATCTVLAAQLADNASLLEACEGKVAACSTEPIHKRIQEAHVRLDSLQAQLSALTSERSRRLGHLEGEAEALALELEGLKQQYTLQCKLTPADVAHLPALVSKLQGKRVEKLRAELVELEGSLAQGPPGAGSGSTGERLVALEERLRQATQEFDEARRTAKDAKDAFARVEKRR
jgi:chromosome segregation ATPase